MYFKTLPTRKLMMLITLLIILAAIPLTVFISQQEQKLKQQAAESEEIVPVKPKINIPDQAAEKNYKRFSKRESLKQSDLQVRNTLIQNLRTTLNIASPSAIEGIIFQNSNVKIEYVSGPDDFEAEILAQNVGLAKAQTETWFRQQGLSNNGICNLPLMFYLSFDLIQQLPEGTNFDPNPLSCP